MGGQDHFYLEPHGSITVPLENNEIKIYASTQVTTVPLENNEITIYASTQVALQAAHCRTSDYAQWCCFLAVLRSLPTWSYRTGSPLPWGTVRVKPVLVLT